MKAIIQWKRKTVKNPVERLTFSALTKFNIRKKKLRTFQYSWESNNAGEGGGSSRRLWKWWGVVAVGIDLFGDKKYSTGNDKLCKSFESSSAATWLLSVYICTSRS